MAFLVPRVGSQEATRDLLQSALVKAMESGGALRDDESATAWFFRVLRNALIDGQRKSDVERRALEQHGAELAPSDAGALLTEVCACVSSLSTLVKPEYEAAVRTVDSEGRSVGEYAEAQQNLDRGTRGSGCTGRAAPWRRSCSRCAAPAARRAARTVPASRCNARRCSFVSRDELPQEPVMNHALSISPSSSCSSPSSCPW